MAKVRQTDAVLHRMMNNGGITAKEAMDELGIYRLSARIYDLLKQGYVITSEFEDVPTRNGDTARVKRYWLGGENGTNIEF